MGADNHSGVAAGVGHTGRCVVSAVEIRRVGGRAGDGARVRDRVESGGVGAVSADGDAATGRDLTIGGDVSIAENRTNGDDVGAVATAAGQLPARAAVPPYTAAGGGTVRTLRSAVCFAVMR